MSPRSIAHYRITTKLGEGGMGEVWRATDTKLNREVAIKILPETFANDVDRLTRFTREAQVLASLNHPNIAAIYGVEDRALVMELAEGPTLADRIAQGPVPVDEALPVARQIAEALEYAHERGIVHRDLKPANIKVTPDGRVKVLDFGLAKALTIDPPSHDPAASPTLTMRSTLAGVILGTAAYMSPEQAKGKPVDRRADIWAFGVVLCEMLTGRPTYSGETVAETLASVIKDTPELSAVPETIPPAVRRILRRCLEKDPRRRLQAIGEARIALEEPWEDVAAAPVFTAAPRSTILPWILAALALVAIATFGLLWRATRPVLQPMMRFSADLGPDAIASGLTPFAISPDGTRIVHEVRTGSSVALATRLLDQSKPILLSETEGGHNPFFSPDGQWLGFFADGKMKQIPVQGGAAVTLCEATNERGASWGEDGNIITSRDGIHLFREPAAGGTPQLIAKPEDKAQQAYRYPQILPGGEAVLLTAGTGGDFENADVAVLALKTGELKVIQHGGYFAQYLASGHLVYIHQGTLFGVPFNLSRLETRGTPAPVLEDVAANPATGSARLSFSRTGTFVYVAGKTGYGSPNVVWMDASGKQAPLVTASGLMTPRLSPDGKRLALSVNQDISVYDLERGAMTRITFTASGNLAPVWTPDGKHIVYSTLRGGIWWTRADGSMQPERILDNRFGTPVGSFSPDGRRLAFCQAGDAGVWVLSLDTTDPDHPKPGKPDRFLQTHVMSPPTFSPDGRWLAYVDVNAGSLHVFVKPYPEPAAGGGRWQISTVPGNFPIWSRNGRELFYETLKGDIMVAEYTARGDTFSPGKPRLWCGTPVYVTGPFPNLDLAPDGKRFVVFPLTESLAGGERASLHLTFLLNFFDELRRKLP